MGLWILLTGAYAIYKNFPLDFPHIFINSFIKLMALTGGRFLLFLIPHFLKNILCYNSLLGFPTHHIYFNNSTTQYLLLLYPMPLAFENFWVQADISASSFLPCLSLHS